MNEKTLEFNDIILRRSKEPIDLFSVDLDQIGQILT